jgi:hypothetical protein
MAIENKTEKFISIMEAKIRVMELEIKVLEKEKGTAQGLAVALAMEYLDGLNVALRVFKVLNDR